MIRFNEGSKLHRVLVALPRVVFFKDSVCSDVEFDSSIQFLRSNLPMDFWMAYYIKHKSQPRYRVPQMIRDLFLGLRDRFPLCCILHFCWDTFWDIKNRKIKRGIKHTKNGVPYIPCFFCKNHSLG